MCLLHATFFIEKYSKLFQKNAEEEVELFHIIWKNSVEVFEESISNFVEFSNSDFPRVHSKYGKSSLKKRVFPYYSSKFMISPA